MDSIKIDAGIKRVCINDDPARVIAAVEEKLGLEAAPLQLPIGLGEAFRGVVDLIEMQAIYFDGPCGENVRREAIPTDLRDAAERARRAHLSVPSRRARGSSPRDRLHRSR